MVGYDVGDVVSMGVFFFLAFLVILALEVLRRFGGREFSFLSLISYKEESGGRRRAFEEGGRLKLWN